MMSLMKDTAIQNPEQLGRAIRLKRQEKSLSQSALAERLGVGRKWIIGIESGNPKAEFGLVLKTLEALGLRAILGEENPASPNPNRRPSTPSRLDEVFRRLQRPGSK